MLLKKESSLMFFLDWEQLLVCEEDPLVVFENCLFILLNLKRKPRQLTT